MRYRIVMFILEALPVFLGSLTILGAIYTIKHLILALLYHTIVPESWNCDSQANETREAIVQEREALKHKKTKRK